MGVRIIAGEFGGRAIETPGSFATHPMSERIRGAIFNKLIDEVQGVTVLDAFAGSGALGIEAVSRGAENAVLIEKDRKAQMVVRKNIDELGVSDRVRLIKADVKSVVGDLGRFSVIFADPPYKDVQIKVVAKLSSVLKDDGVLVLSLPVSMEGEMEGIFTDLELFDKRRYADAVIGYYKGIGGGGGEEV